MPTRAQLTKVSCAAGRGTPVKNFFDNLPPATQAGAGGSIVWDAEVMGFTLTERTAFTTNFASLNTGANAGAAGNAAFATAVATSIFGNTTLTNQVLAYLQSFETFLTTNPTELTGNGIPVGDLVKAADALTFGTEVGVALSNPTTVGTTLEAEVTNALIANAEFLNGQGPTPVGVALQLVPPATPLQGQPVTTFTLTVGTDNLTAGQPALLPGSPQNGTIVPTSDVVINGPLAGGTQHTLTSGDVISLSGGGNTLNAFFNAAGLTTIGGLTIQGVQTAEFQNGTGAVIEVNGGSTVFGPGSTGATSSPGLQTLTLQNSAITDLFVGGISSIGGAGTGIQSVPSAINVINTPNSEVIVFINASLFTGSNTITVTVQNAPTEALIDAGPDTPTSGTTAKGYTGWTLNSTGGSGVTNFVDLGATTSVAATAMALQDDGANTDLHTINAANWENLTLMSGIGTTTGTWTITGAESGGGGFLSDLTGAGGAFSIQLDNANGNSADLSAWTGTAANLKINLGSGTGNVLAANSNLADTTVAFGQFLGVATLDDADTTGGVLAGTVNMTFFPGVTDLTLVGNSGLTSAATLSGNLIVNDVPAITSGTGFTLNMGTASLGGHNVALIGVGGAGDILTVDVGPTPAAVTVLTGGTGTFSAVAFDAVKLNDTNIGLTQLGGTLFQTEATLGDNAVVNVTIAGPGNLWLGNLFPTAASVGHETVQVLGGTIADPVPGTINVTSSSSLVSLLDIGVTDAATINATATAEVDMTGPDDSILYGTHPGDTVMMANASLDSVLQGDLGPLTQITSAGYSAADPGWTGATDGGTSNPTVDTLTDAAPANAIWVDGGAAKVNIGGGSNSIMFGAFLTGGTLHNQIITDDADNAYTGFWGIGTPGTLGTPTAPNASTAVDNTVINGFVSSNSSGPPAIFHDTLEFNVASWANDTLGAGALVQVATAAAATLVTTGASVMQVVAPGGTIAGGTNVVLYTPPGPVTGALGLATALSSAADAISLNAGATIAAHEHMLFVYNDAGTTEIADVDFLTAIAAGGSTHGATIVASDMAGIVNVSLAGLAANPADINFIKVQG